MRRSKNESPSYERPATIIGQDAVMEANLLQSKESVQIAGKYIGNLKIQSSLVIVDTGKVEGDVEAAFVLVSGEIKGNIKISQQLHITSKGRVIGDVVCKNIVIDEGGYIDGNCKMVRESEVSANEKAIKKSGKAS